MLFSSGQKRCLQVAGTPFPSGRMMFYQRPDAPPPPNDPPPPPEECELELEYEPDEPDELDEPPSEERTAVGS